MTFRERYEKWKAGELVYSAGKILLKYDGGKDDEQSYYDRAMDLIIKGEGFRDSIYQNKGDVPTAGYGFTAKKDLHTWKESDARKRAREIMMQNEDSIKRSAISDWYSNQASDGQKAALLDMLYQGGPNRLDSMPKFVKAILSGDINAAAREFNFAASQTPNRHKARYAAFIEGIRTPADFVKENIQNQQTIVRDNTNVNVPVMQNITATVPNGLEYISKYSGTPITRSLSEIVRDNESINNLLTIPQYIIDPMQYVSQFQLNQPIR